MRRSLIALGLLVGLVGCGQTDYATEVSEDSAQLNGTITTLTDGVETTAWFEYWPAATPANVSETSPQNVTATGPVSADIGGLANHTEYRYRLCGTEDDSEVVCAQDRRFTTGRDTVQAYGESARLVWSDLGDVHWFEQLDFDAVGLPAGTSGPAFAEYMFEVGSNIVPFEFGSHTAPTVTCFDVEDDVAVIGLRARIGSEETVVFLELVDGGPLGSGEDAISILFNGPPFPTQPEPDRDAGDCSPTGKPRFQLIAGEIAVNEAPPAPG
jgi:hypothetical protein